MGVVVVVVVGTGVVVVVVVGTGVVVVVVVGTGVVVVVVVEGMHCQGRGWHFLTGPQALLW